MRKNMYSIAFVEISAPSDQLRENLIHYLNRLGFTQIGTHKHKQIILFKQNDIFITINCETTGRGACREGAFVRAHGVCASAFGLWVNNPESVFSQSIQRGAVAYKYVTPYQTPVLQGPGDTVIYLCDHTYTKGNPSGFPSFFNEHFYIHDQYSLHPISKKDLQSIHHITIASYPEFIQEYAFLFKKILQFKEINSYTEKGYKCINFEVEQNKKSFITLVHNEQLKNGAIHTFLEKHQGDGICHIGFLSPNLKESLRNLNTCAIFTEKPPLSYYDKLSIHFADSMRNLFDLSKHHILLEMDRSMKTDVNYLHAYLHNQHMRLKFEIVEQMDDEFKTNKGRIGNLTNLLY